MAKSMTKSAIIGHLAQKASLSKKQVTELMDQLLSLATKEAKNVFVVPGSAGSCSPIGRPGWAATRRPASPSRSPRSAW
jgi:hypothetical protein